MSWDATATDFVDGREAEVHDVNYTSNTNRMIREAGWPEWPNVGPVMSPEMGAKLGAVVAALTADPARFDAMAPENKWGDRLSLLAVLAHMLAVTCRHPEALWTVES